MANKERNKRSARQARQRERAEREALAAQATTKNGKKAVSQSKKTTPVKATASNENKGLIGRTRSYLGEVRAEGLHVASFTDAIPFRATGRVITEPAWQVLWAKKKTDEQDSSEEKDGEEEGTLPAFTKGESGPHEPNLAEKQTTPPKPYTEATLLRAMETAGKLVEDDELRDALKENGIGRPSTRAAIIETLFKRNYIRRNRKSLAPTETGKQLIGIIQNELLKSAELTGHWERKLRQIERHEYEARQFIDELKQMVTDLVLSVMADNSAPQISDKPNASQST